MELELAQRKAILASQVAKWPKATKQEKSEILDAICQVTGWHRDHARKMIRRRSQVRPLAPQDLRTRGDLRPGRHRRARALLESVQFFVCGGLVYK